jgi:hypothetical protein
LLPPRPVRFPELSAFSSLEKDARSAPLVGGESRVGNRGKGTRTSVLKELTVADEARIVALVKRAVS